MKVTYIFHSGFLVETAKCSYIFDYYKGDIPALDTGKPVVVFASHNHADHYNPEVFTLLKNAGIKDITAVLSKDIPEKNYPANIPAVKVHGARQYTLPNGDMLNTLISTDAGVAFLLTTDEGTIYHAGDLNDWTWEGESESFNKQMRGSYRKYIDDIRGTHIDIAMVPLDPRQEMHYDAGMLYFISTVKPEAIFPMHYWEQPDIINKFLLGHSQYSHIIKNTQDYSGGNL